MFFSLVTAALEGLGLIASARGKSTASSEPGKYRRVTASDLLGGYVEQGDWIEVVGHVWSSEGHVLFNAHHASVRAPMEVDVSQIAAEKAHLPTADAGGRRMTIRGRTGILHDRPVILATEMLPDAEGGSDA